MFCTSASIYLRRKSYRFGSCLIPAGATLIIPQGSAAAAAVAAAVAATVAAATAVAASGRGVGPFLAAGGKVEELVVSLLDEAGGTSQHV
jgi:hypothetical protein